MTSVFEEIFDLTRNNQYNYFGGILQILPKGRRVRFQRTIRRLDSTRTVNCGEIREEVSNDELLPDGRDYRRNISSGGASAPENEEPTAEVTDTEATSWTFDDDEEIFTMHNGDARKAVSELQTLIKEEKGKDTFLDATVTSPPYFDLKDYGSDDTNEVGQHGSYIEYLDELRAIFEHVYSITNEDGSLWVVVNTFRRNHELIQLPFDIARVCKTQRARDGVFEL